MGKKPADAALFRRLSVQQCDADSIRVEFRAGNFRDPWEKRFVDGGRKTQRLGYISSRTLRATLRNMTFLFDVPWQIDRWYGAAPQRRDATTFRIASDAPILRNVAEFSSAIIHVLSSTLRLVRYVSFKFKNEYNVGTLRRIFIVRKMSVF